MNIINDYNDTLSTKITEIYNNTLSPNCTSNENNFDIIIPTLILTIPFGLSFSCLMSLMLYKLIKPFFNNKKEEVSLPNSSSSLH